MDSAIEGILNKLRHYLPAQAPLKDFIHHNTLHAFQQEDFFKGLNQASGIFGYNVLLNIKDYRLLYQEDKISDSALRTIVNSSASEGRVEDTINKMLYASYEVTLDARIGKLRSVWKNKYKVNLDKVTHPLLLRLVSSYLDQGISIWNFPLHESGFLASIRAMEEGSFSSFIKSPRARKLLSDTHTTLKQLLDIVVGDSALFERYLFDQQFAHPGWSGMVAVLEKNPNYLLDKRMISLHDFIFIELLLEIDYLDRKWGLLWPEISRLVTESLADLFSPVTMDESFRIRTLWQQAYEWTYYDQVIAGLQVKTKQTIISEGSDSFQAVFCIDDRSCSLRRYLEQLAPNTRTYGTPGFFNVEFYFQPEEGRFLTKVCPAPVQPKYIIQESNSKKRYKRDLHFSKHSQGLFGGWFISQTMGFWSALQLLGNVFRPTASPAMVSSFQHMDPLGDLSIHQREQEPRLTELQVGFTWSEMADRVAGLLGSIGMKQNFSPLVYLIGHGASSVNNTHYAGYDCGACSGRAGSVNARVAAWMANQQEVRSLLKEKGIFIPDTVQFIGGLHDTTRDEITFYDIDTLMSGNRIRHQKNEVLFNLALSNNAKERSRRFILMSTQANARQVHKQVKLRALSLFEPRPELNHATNALCIIGRRDISKHLFLDRRAFLNSYDPNDDPEGKYLAGILRAVAPVCGGINLEYFFSRTDPYRLGAGTKLPHNVIGLLGVANGVDGDLRPGLPTQMIEVHDPLRLLVIVEQDPDFVIQVLNKEPGTRQWFDNNWIHLVAIRPSDNKAFRYQSGEFIVYDSHGPVPQRLNNLADLIESSSENIPVLILTETV